jgi:hypothetical protein
LLCKGGWHQSLLRIREKIIFLMISTYLGSKGRAILLNFFLAVEIRTG